MDRNSINIEIWIDPYLYIDALRCTPQPCRKNTDGKDSIFITDAALSISRDNMKPKKFCLEDLHLDDLSFYIFSEYISVDNSQTKSWDFFLNVDLKIFFLQSILILWESCWLTILDLGFKIPPQTDVLSFRNKNARQ